MAVQELEGTGARSRTKGEIVDCDVHNELKSRAVLKKDLPERWHVYYDQGLAPDSGSGVVYAHARPSVFRIDTRPAEGPPGSDLDLMRAQLLDLCGVAKAILHPVLLVQSLQQFGELGAALATAVNEWMVEEWFDRDDRIYGAITVSSEDGERAAAEIRRAARHPRFAKVTMLISTREPLGHDKYWPIFEAAAEEGLPVALHVAGRGGLGSAAGFPAYQIERHTLWTLAYPAQVTSLVYSGVFERFPTLQFVMEEGGLAWFPSTMWRLDRAWKSMRDQVPHLAERPSEVARRHFWLATQPLDEPEQHGYLAHLFDQLDLDDHVLFSSDYPHHDFDDPGRVLPASAIGADRRRKFLVENAEHVFRFAS
jgi:predicted TIM-barrel fold metal-dependent hydrolase